MSNTEDNYTRLLSERIVNSNRNRWDNFRGVIGGVLVSVFSGLVIAAAMHPVMGGILTLALLTVIVLKVKIEPVQFLCPRCNSDYLPPQFVTAYSSIKLLPIQFMHVNCSNCGLSIDTIKSSNKIENKSTKEWFQ